MADADRRSTLLDAYENAAMIVSGIDADKLGHPTPCPKYDVAGLIDHLVEAGRRAAALGRGQAPPPGDQSPHVELPDAPGQLRSAAEEAARAWGDNASLSVRHAMPWGEEPTTGRAWPLSWDATHGLRPADEEDRGSMRVSRDRSAKSEFEFF